MSKAVKSDSLKEVLLAQENNAVSLVFCVILALVLPFFLIPIEKYILPWPWLVEELVKTVVVVFLILPLSGKNFKILGAIIFALIFSLSESIFYFLNFAQHSSIDQYSWRFVWPTLMHTFTVFFMLLLAWRDRRLVFLAMIITMIIHYIYNTRLVTYLDF